MASLGNLSLTTSIRTGEYSAGLRKMQSETLSTVRSIGSSFASLKNQVGTHLSALRGGGIAGLGAGLLGGTLGAGFQSLVSGVQTAGAEFGRFVQNTLAAVRAQETLAQTLGTSRESAVALRAAAEAGGITDFVGVAQRAQERFGELRRQLAAAPAGAPGAGGEAAASLRRLGIDAERFASMRIDQQLGALGDGLRGIESSADRANISRSILGEGWREMLPLLRQGTEGFNQIRQQAREFGAVAGDDVIRGIQGTNAELRNLRIASGLAAQGLQTDLATGFMRVTEGASSAAEQMRRLREEHARMRPVAENVGRLGGFFQNFGRRFMEAQTWAHAATLRSMNLLPSSSLSATGGGIAPQPQPVAPDRIRQANEAASTFVNTLRRQADTWQLNAQQVQRYDLVQRGASAEALRAVDVQLTRLRELEAQHRQMIESQRQGEQTFAAIRQDAESARSTFATVQARIAHIEGMGRFLSEQESGALMRQALQPALARGMSTSLPGLMERGSVDAVSAVNAAAGMSRDIGEVIRAGLQGLRDDEQEQTQIDGRILEVLREIARNNSEIPR